MPNFFLRETLKSIETVMPSFKFVNVDEKRLNRVAEENALRDFNLPRWDFPGCQPQSNEAFLSHCFWWSVINFCFDYSRRNGDGQLTKFRARTSRGEPVSGAYAMEACFYGVFGERPIETEELKMRISTFSKFKKMFQGVNSMPMLRQRWDLLNGTIAALEKFFDGQVKNLVGDGRYRAFGGGKTPGIVELLIDCLPETFGEDKFADSGYFSPAGKLFYFYKRAQLFVLMYHGRAASSGGELRPIEDIEDIGPIADYELPKSYAAEGILLYSPELQEKIDKALPLERHSQPEVEIRVAFTRVHIEELRIINAKRRENGLPPIHIGHLDYHRWLVGRKNKAINHHLCFTTDY